MAFFLAGSPAQLDDSLADLTSLPHRVPAGPGGAGGSARAGGRNRACCRLVQRALDAGLAGRPWPPAWALRASWHQHLLGRGHHGADGGGLGQCLAAARAPGRPPARLRRRRVPWLGATFSWQQQLVGFDPAFFASAAAHRRRPRRGLRGLRFSLAGGLSGAWAAASARSLAPRASCSSRWRRFSSEILFLAADQLGLSAGFFLATRQFGVVDQVPARAPRPARGRGAGGVPSSRLMKVRFLRTSTWMVRALPEVGLLDLAGGFLHQRDLLALGRAVPWLACR
jgi:hypothetical protein